MASDEKVLELARTVRPELRRLWGKEREAEAAAIDAALGQLLAEAQTGADVRLAILDRLREPPEVHAWAARFLASGMPPGFSERRDATRGLPGYSPLAGDGVPLAGGKFACPEGGDTVWYQHSVGQDPPACSTHHRTLEPVPVRAR
jgi:hypothetical protein